MMFSLDSFSPEISFKSGYTYRFKLSMYGIGNILENGLAVVVTSR